MEPAGAACIEYGEVNSCSAAVYCRYRCRPLDVAADDEYHHCRAVMHVSCGRAEAVVLICLPGNAAADAMATEVGRLFRMGRLLVSGCDRNGYLTLAMATGEC